MALKIEEIFMAKTADNNEGKQGAAMWPHRKFMRHLIDFNKLANFMEEQSLTEVT